MITATLLGLGLVAQQTVAQEKNLEPLGIFIGKFAGKGVLSMVADKPGFDIAASGHWILGNKAVAFDESYSIMGQKVENHLLIRYDSQSKGYRLWHFSNTTTEPMVFSGTVDEKGVFTFQSEIGKTGYTTQPHKFTFVRGKDGFGANLEVQYGQTWKPMLASAYSLRP